MNIKTRVKPDLSTGHGGLVDPEFIPAAVRKHLLESLSKSPLTDKHKDALLIFSNDIGQMVIADDIETGKKQREQIEAVATNARRLLSSIKLLGEPARDALDINSDYLAKGSAPPVQLDRHIKTAITRPGNNLLSSAWDWVAALETAAIYTAGQFNIDRTSKPEQMRARGFVSLLAQHVINLTGSPPPKDPASWFAGFAECLGEHLRLPIGPRIIRTGIKAVR